MAMLYLLIRHVSILYYIGCINIHLYVGNHIEMIKVYFDGQFALFRRKIA